MPFGLFALVCMLVAGVGCSADASPAASAGYRVVPADDEAKGDVRWAEYLRDHLRPRAEGGKRLVPDEADKERGLFGLTVRIDSLLKMDFCVERQRRSILITARDARTMLWLQYQLMKSLGDEDPRIEASDLPPATVGLRDTCGRFAFGFRGLYTPAAQDEDYAGILSVDNVETGWGLWGHQLSRVLTGDVSKEVFATVGGETYDGQFCFSSDETFRRIENHIMEHFGEGDSLPTRFVIAPADDDAVCTCKACSAVGNTSKTATPAVMRMLARLAARFPHHTFFTLGYLSTQEPPAVAMAANTGVIVSAMELPFASEALKTPQGRKFAARLDRWKNVTGNVYVWDYVQNFDDYLTPFPVLEGMAERLRFYRDRGVEGIFLNGSGYDYVPFDDMRTWVLASLMRDPGQPVEVLMRRFFAENYPESGGLLADFCAFAERRAAARKRRLNLYGGIRDAEASWLDAGEFVRFYEELERTLPVTKDAERRHLHELVTALSYTRLEVARSHAGDAFGMAERKGDRLRVKPGTERWLATLAEHASFAGMKYVSESALPVGDYIGAWRSRILGGSETRSLLLGVALKSLSKPDEGYSDTGVLTDGVRGLGIGYHYGWHISSADLELEIPVDAASCAQRFEMSFLELPCHRLRAPQRVEVYRDGVLCKTFVPTPDGENRIFTAAGPVDLSGARRITVRAVRPEGERVQLAADEIYLIP